MEICRKMRNSKIISRGKVWHQNQGNTSSGSRDRALKMRKLLNNIWFFRGKNKSYEKQKIPTPCMCIYILSVLSSNYGCFFFSISHFPSISSIFTHSFKFTIFFRSIKLVLCWEQKKTNGRLNKIEGAYKFMPTIAHTHTHTQTSRYDALCQ